MHGIGTSANTPTERKFSAESAATEVLTTSARIVAAGVFVLSLAFLVASVGVLFAAVRWVW